MLLEVLHLAVEFSSVPYAQLSGDAQNCVYDIFYFSIICYYDVHAVDVTSIAGSRAPRWMGL